MKESEFSLKKQKRFYIFFVISVITLILIGQSVVHYFLFLQDDDATVINLAGRQRMLSQRITKNYLPSRKLELNQNFLQTDTSNKDLSIHNTALIQNREIIEEDLITFKKVHNQLQGTDLNSFKIVHDALQRGNDSIGIQGTRSIEVKKLFVEIQPFFEKIVEIVDKRLDDNLSNESDYLNLIYNESKFLPLMDKIVFTMNSEADERVDSLVYVESVILIVTLVVIALEWYFLFIPTLNSTEKYYNDNLSAQKKLAEENRTKLTIIRNFNHEFMTPMNIINGNIALLESIEEYDAESVKDMHAASDDLSMKLKKITTFAKFQLNKELGLNYVNLLSIIENIFTSKLKLARSNQIELVHELSNEINVYCNEEAITILLNEIIENGIKFNEKGFVKVITVKNGFELYLIIEDDGDGMDQNLFNNSSLFSQEDDSQARQYDGLGMGISIIKSIAYASDIDVKCESKKDKGTKIILTFTKFA